MALKIVHNTITEEDKKVKALAKKLIEKWRAKATKKRVGGKS